MADGDRIPKVLVVDDEPNIRELVEVALKFHGCAVAVSASGKDALHQVGAYDPDLMILDVMLPDMDGFEVCRTLRSEGNDFPVIFLTGHTDQASVQRIFTAGADDYVGKPFVPAELMMRIESRLTGVKARKALVETDPLTGLATSAKATELIDRFLRLARRKADPYSIAVLQVDSFTDLASIYGRALSDSVLRGIGQLLPKAFRAEDVPGWWGGADFTIGMYGSSKEFAAIKLTQICAKVAELSFLAEDGRRVQISCSGGVAQYQIDGDAVAALRDEAFKALEQARASGGSTRVGISGVKAIGPMTRRVDVAIVDDDSAMVSLLQHAMEMRSMRVACFADGETAVAALTGGSPEVQASVILLGVDLPALNGLEVLRRLKAGEVTRSSSVVMLTSRTGERDVLAALELGATDHIAKPFSVPVLMHKVRSVLKQSQAWSA